MKQKIFFFTFSAMSYILSRSKSTQKTQFISPFLYLAVDWNKNNTIFLPFLQIRLFPSNLILKE
jgi:hypothetical protein